jgi:methyl-accepting chemotaxis protein
MKMRHLFWQIIFTALAIVLIVVSGSLYIGNILHSHMRRNAEAVLATTGLKIEIGLVEPETALNIISMTIRSMILRGESKDIILQYMKEIYVGLQGKQIGFKTDSIYGYFDVFEGAFLHSKGWSGGAGYNPTERPWYKAAVAAGDKLDATPLYWNLQLNDYCITFVRRLFNEAGQPLGVVCLNVLVGDIIKGVTEMKLTKGSYGVLHDEYFNIYYHPDSSIVGENWRDVSGGIAALGDEILAGKTFSEYEATNFSGALSIAFSSRLKNGWFLFFIIPKAEYYQGTRDMALLLGVFGLFLAVGLIIIFICVDKAKQKSD